MRYFVEIAFKGTHYHGWQIQPNANTVQEEINKSLKVYTQDENVSSMGCGRTDTGVHASQFFFHFDTELILNLEDFIYRLNILLPKDIAVRNIKQVGEELHTRFFATSRTYQYHIATTKDPFEEAFQYKYYYPLDMDLMNRACKLLIGKQDFSCFSKSNTDTVTNICDLTKAEWCLKESVLTFEITANRFLRNMVRAIVGTLLDVGRGKLTLEEFKTIIDSRNRSNAGTSAPAKGLFLVAVSYPEF